MTDTEKEKLISSASNFEELEKALEKIGEVSGKSGTYSSSDLIQRINHVRNSDFEINAITRGLGLREKVEELLKKERG